MKRRTTLIASALSISLATGVLVGCGGTEVTPATDAETTAEETGADVATTEDVTTDATGGESQEELVAEVTAALENRATCTSVTVQEETDSQFADGDPMASTVVYKFDESNGTVKTSAEYEVDGTAIARYTDGDQGAVVYNGKVYGGTTEQVTAGSAQGIEQYLEYFTGSGASLLDSTESVSKLASAGLSFYTLQLDVNKYVASNEELSLLADNGMPLKEARIALGFDEEGHIVTIDRFFTYEGSSSEWHAMFTDFDATTVDEMPEATATYDEFEADLTAEFAEAYGDEAAAE